MLDNVDYSLVMKDSWKGCAWVFEDGRVLAVDYAHHHYGAQHTHLEATGENTSLYLEDFAEQYHAVHVGGDVWARHRPTQAQKNAVIDLSEFDMVKKALERQSWHIVNDANSSSPGWPL